MINAKIRQSDLKSLDKKFKQLKRLSEQEFSNEIGTMAFDMVATAKRIAPVDTGNLRALIGLQKTGPNRVEVFSKAPYSPYIEFGTGKVNLQDMKELGIPESYAAQFKGAKSGNMKAQPFFFISARKALQSSLKSIENRIKRLTK
jgi:HK97 gp10 family phage protein